MLIGNLQYTPLVVPLIAAAAVVLTLAIYAYGRRRIAGAGTFVVLMLGLGQWSLAYALVIASTQLETKMFWYQFEYVGVVLVPTAWMLFGLRYTRQPMSSKRYVLLLAAAEPVTALVLAATNGTHHLMWPTARVEDSGTFLALAVTFGPGYWVNTLYSYVVALAGTAALAATLIRARQFYGRQAAALAIASVAPVVGNAIYSFGLSGDLDLAPFSFAVSGVAFFWGFLRYGFLDVAPIARGSVFEAIADAVLVLDIQGKVVDLNPAACRTLDVTPNSVIGRPVAAVLPTLTEQEEEIALVVDGAECLYEIRTSPVHHGQQGTVGQLLLLHDVSEQRAAAVAVRASEERFRAQFKNLPMPTYSWQHDGTNDFALVAFNDAAAARDDWKAQKNLGRRASELFEHRHEVVANLRRCYAERKTFKHEMPSALGDEHRLLDMTFTFVEPELVMVHVEDITTRRQAEQALEHQALHDALTDLPNRKLLRRQLQTTLLERAEECALMIMDLDRFKEVNDTLGHRCGDLLLMQVAGRLRAAVPERHVVARLGGDEFAVLLFAAVEESAVALARQLVDSFEKPFEVEGSSVQVGASIGISFSARHGRDLDELVRRADVAMYSAKRANSGFAVYDPATDDNSPDRLSLVADLRRAMASDQLFLEFQPKIDLETDQVIGAEALLRWRHPQRGLIAPTEFIPLAEQTGLIGPLTRWVLHAALRQCAAWRAGGIDVPLAVNLSMHDLHDVDLPARLATLLAELNVPAASLEVEVTESLLMSQPDRAAQVTRELSRLGVRVTVDDFGTGYSSLAYLGKLHINGLKIDRSIVGDMARHKADRLIVKSMVDLAHGLALDVVAEGVEDEATFDLLRELGCDQAQGYLLGRPMAAAQFAQVVQSQSSTARAA